ncbi:MAG TPA: sterol desaturase family protein [Saprospiraceae bacterium]|nr:sterol desaturase family protein [Saprospiraceae bacterium]
MKYWETFVNGYTGYANYLWNEILNPSWHNYFYWLIGISLFFWLLEIAFPWRKNQSAIRKDFWLDGFYMFFNFFLFSLIGYNAVSNVFSQAFNDFIRWAFGWENLVAIRVHQLPWLVQLGILFIVRDFIQWNVHRLLHRSEWLWQFHKVHHSVEEMGFAAHLRYHWMETIVYRTLEYIPLAMIGFGVQDFLVVHIFTLAVGHFNHSNIRVPLGPLKYIFNNPQMHIWHHAEHIPNRYGVNFGLTLSIWDYIFKTNYVPRSGRDEKLGFDQLDAFPKTFLNQFLYPFYKKNIKNEKTNHPAPLAGHSGSSMQRNRTGKIESGPVQFPVG